MAGKLTPEERSQAQREASRDARENRGYQQTSLGKGTNVVTKSSEYLDDARKTYHDQYHSDRKNKK